MKNKPRIVVYYNNDEIPSYVRDQILDLSDKASCNLASKYRKLNIGRSLSLSNKNGHFDDNDGLYIVSVLGRNENTKVVGYLHYFNDQSDDFIPKAVCIHNIWIEPEYRKLGIGSEMVRKLINELGSGRQFFISVLSNNKEGLAFWKKLGFITPEYTTYYLNSY